MTSTQLSRAAYERLQLELEQRSTIGRREISERIERAREHGDIRENADYDAAKNDQGLNEARIRQLDVMLKGAVVVEDVADGGSVAAGTIVEIRVEGDDEVETYLVGSIEERHEQFDVLSTASPLGTALLGCAPGDVVEYQGPSGRIFTVEVVAVRPAG